MDVELAALHGANQERGESSRSLGTHSDLERLNASFEQASALEVVRWAHERFSGGVALSSSFGADSALMLHLVTRVIPDVPVVFVDTGYLFPETYRFAESLRERLKLNLLTYAPEMTTARQEAVFGKLWEQGDEGVKRYLAMNKVAPMQRALRELGVKAWLAGLRATQTDHRRSLRKVAVQDGRVKIHPILDWSRDQVAAYFKEHDLPRHPLFEEGYRSVGDWHSTWPVAPDEDERAGRVLGVKKECGLHLNAEENSSFTSSGL